MNEYIILTLEALDVIIHLFPTRSCASQPRVYDPQFVVGEN